MLRILVVLLALLSLTGVACAEGAAAPSAAQVTLFTHTHSENGLFRSHALPTSARSTPLALACCKVCSVGKACGNTCISREKTCHVGQGCVRRIKHSHRPWTRVTGSPRIRHGKAIQPILTPPQQSDFGTHLSSLGRCSN